MLSLLFSHSDDRGEVNRFRRLSLESLEDRRLLTVFADSFDDYVVGDPPGGDWIVNERGATIRVDDDAFLSPPNSVHFLDSGGGVDSDMFHSFDATSLTTTFELDMLTNSTDKEGPLWVVYGEGFRWYSISFSNGAGGSQAGSIGLLANPGGWIKPDLLVGFKLATWYHARQTMDLATKTFKFEVWESADPTVRGEHTLVNPSYDSTYLDTIQVTSSFSQGVDAHIDNLLVCDVCTTTIEVAIDTKPDSDPNSINLKSNGVIPVAILTTSVADGDLLDFDATSVDPSTIEFGDTRDGFARVSPVRTAVEDVDGDGDFDLIVHFSTREVRDSGALNADSVDAVLSAETLDGTEVFGIDAVRIVPKKK